MSDKIRSLKRIIKQEGFCYDILCENCYFNKKNFQTNNAVFTKCSVLNYTRDEVIKMSKILLRELKLKKICQTK